MQFQDSLKREFLKKWIKGLQSLTPSKLNNMTLFQRKKAIKLSADLAMASTRNSTRFWSRAIITKAFEDEETTNLANKILGRFDETKCSSSKNMHITRRSLLSGNSNNKNKVVSKKISNFKKCVPKKFGPSNSYKVKARSMAKRLVKKRMQILKGLVPGGECMDECSLIKETLDYIVSLRAQVDVMHYLANSPQLLIHN